MLTIVRIVRSIPNHPYGEIATDILGRKYNLTLAFIGETRAKALNTKHRGKSYTPNVLSFPLTADTGEIYIC